jgi:hypothetical protein
VIDMFWKRIHSDPLAERFRLVLEFATLGAYDEATSASPLVSEEREPVDGGAAAPPRPRACAAHRLRSATTGRNVARTSDACTARSPHFCGGIAQEHAARPRPRDRDRRLGAKTPEQPCTWLGELVAPYRQLDPVDRR